LPVFHLTSKPPATFANKLATAWERRPVALDGLFNFNTTGTQNDFINMFGALGVSGFPVIPSVDCDAPSAFLSAIYGQINKFAPGVVVKADAIQLPRVAAWLAAQRWAPQDVDLIINLGSISASISPHFVASAITSSQITALPWRSLTLASSAAPKDYSALSLGRNLVPRLDWSLWQGVAAQGFPLDYGDYGTANPDLTELPGPSMGPATVSVRYCTDSEWIILRGRSTTGLTGLPMSMQYSGHAQVLHSDTAFGGISGCWGDFQIQQIIAGACSPGGRIRWAEIGLNRHLSLVADRLP
jgi:hypothetical protein